MHTAGHQRDKFVMIVEGRKLATEYCRRVVAPTAERMRGSRPERLLATSPLPSLRCGQLHAGPGNRSERRDHLSRNDWGADYDWMAVYDVNQKP